MSRRAAAMRRESAKVDKLGIRKSFESGAVKVLEGMKGVSAIKVAVGKRNVFSTAGMDLVR
jgi:hypothetical protein